MELVAAKILGPTLWGVWYFLNLAIAYRGVTYFGIVNGMNREVPINLGKKKKDNAQILEDVTFSTVVLTSIITCILLAAGGMIIEDDKLSTAIFWLIPLFISTQFYYLVNTSLKANTLFEYVSRKQFLFSILFPIIALPLTVILGLKGFIIGFAIALLVSVTYIYRASPLAYHFKYDLNWIKELIRIGFPIMAVGIAYTFLNTVDRWVIGLLLGTEQLGYYSMAIIVFAGMTLFPKVISQQLYPRMAYDWGKTGSKKELKRWSWLQTKYTSYLVVPLLICVLSIFPWIIRTFLPEYEPGIQALLIIVFGPLFIPFSAGWGNVLNIIDKQVYYLAIIIVAVITNLTINYLLVVNGYGIEGVALGTAITFALYCVSIMIAGKWALKNKVK